MTQRLSAEERYERIAERMNEWYGQVEPLAAKHLDLAGAFRRAMAEVASEVGEEYAADFEQRLATERVAGGWPDPSLLAELKQRNPAGMETFLGRFQAISDQQRQSYEAEADELIHQMYVERHAEQTEQPKRSRIRELARATWRGLGTTRL